MGAIFTQDIINLYTSIWFILINISICGMFIFKKSFSQYKILMYSLAALFLISLVATFFDFDRFKDIPWYIFILVECIYWYDKKVNKGGLTIIKAISIVLLLIVVFPFILYPF